MAGLNRLGHGGTLTGWVNPTDGHTYDGPSIPVKLTLKWLSNTSEIGHKWMAENGLHLSPSIEAKIMDIKEAFSNLDWPVLDRLLEYRNDCPPISEIEPWGDERNRKVGGDFIIYVNSAELIELLSLAEYALELWEMYGADEHLLSIEDGYDFYADDIPGNRMLYYATLRSLKTAVKRLARLRARLEDVYYAEA